MRRRLSFHNATQRATMAARWRALYQRIIAIRCAAVKLPARMPQGQ
jgi:hypothetical protein